MNLKNCFFKLLLLLSIFIQENKSSAQNIVLEEFKTPNLIVNLNSCFKFSIENGYFLDTIFIENGFILNLTNNELCLVSKQIGSVIINFKITSQEGKSFYIKKKLSTIEFPKPILQFYNNNRKPILDLNIENLDSLNLNCHWNEVHANCYLKSFKILVIFKDSNSNIFSCHHNNIPDDFKALVINHKDEIEEVIFLNIKVKTEIGELILNPIHFIN